MESHTDTATVEAPVAESTEAVESLPQETTQDSFLDALDSALSNITESPLENVEIEEPKEEAIPEPEVTEESADKKGIQEFEERNV